MSDFIENQVQLLLAGQALENDICNAHILGDTIGMSSYLYSNYCHIKRFVVHDRKMI